MKKIAISILLVFSINHVKGQSPTENNFLLEDVAETLTETLNESSQSDLPEELIRLSSGQIDLNSEDIELLVIAKLLTDEQSKAIKEYIIHYGKFIETEELQQITILNKKTIQKILPYSSVYSKKEVSSSTQLIIRYQQSLLQTENYYNGSLSKVLFRIKSTLNSSWKAGLTFEKDEGEEMFTKNKPTFDYTSFHLVYTGNKLIKRLILGDYNLECGQGLNIWSGLSFGSSSLVTSIYKYGRGIVPYSGTDENRFFRGIGISLERKHLQFDGWISFHKIDANTYTDSVSGSRYVTSLQFSGFHRSYSEMSDFHSQKEYAAGMHFKYNHKNGELGLVTSGQQYTLPIIGNPNPYSLYAFKGNMNINSGIYFTYTLKNILFFGEESVCSNGSIATINGILISADPKLSFGISYRNYPIKYHNMKSNSFGVNSANINERGLYFALNYTFIKTLTYSLSIDAYSFPFLKYKVDAPSNGNDMNHELNYKPNKKVDIQFRYRERRKQENQSTILSDYGIITDYAFKSLRFSSIIKIDKAWTSKMRLEYIKENSGTQFLGEGTMISQDLFYHPMGKKYSLNMRYALFNCPDFSTRIYSYENDVQGAFSIPFYYGNGNRFYININLHPGRRINFSVRYSTTFQENNELYNPKSDIKMQLKVSM